MEDENAVKAPVTRLRRRLSVEQSDDAKSSSAPNTPTKKRGGRRAAKPELDLIDENAPEKDTTKKFTKKNNMKELEVEEKPVTPSRRSARIKSNTSIILETTQVIDSPRAKRASRRTSQVGSDNEGPPTPARQIKRIPRDSVNTDKAEPQPVAITDIIIEEPETSSQKPLNNSEKLIEQSLTPSGLRKSPRLSLKKNKGNDSIGPSENEKNKSENNNNNSKTAVEFNEREIDKSEEHNNSNKENDTSHMKETHESNNLIDEENNKLSVSNIELLSKINTEPIKINRNVNKSSSAIADTDLLGFKNKRHRTRSWTSLSHPVQNDNKCYSDSESTKKTINIVLNTSNNGNTKNVSKHIDGDVNVCIKEKINSVRDTSINELETELVNSSNRKKSLLSPNNPRSPTMTNLFDKEPSNDMQTLIYIEESDSNSEKIKSHECNKYENQNVSIVKTPLHNQETSPKKEKMESVVVVSQGNEENVIVNKNDSCEPMDIDGSITDNIDSNKSLLKTVETSENNDSSEVKNETNVNANETNKSRRSSATLITSQAINKTNDNQSTLILSQLKDISNENNMSESLQIVTEKNLTNQALNFTHDNEEDKRNLSMNYLTSTPLQEKKLFKLANQVNTSSIICNNTIDKGYSNMPIPNKGESQKKSEDPEPGDDSSQERSNFLDKEAEEASDDYESGDSRDDEEKQYEREHEIVQKGETLTSEDELSNDIDYEKDSFVVSSDQEDGELLDGSGDDLSSSDNELKMTKKSKKKFNERKTKEQKKASREMFLSRHKMIDPNKSNESYITNINKNRTILDSSDSEHDNIQVKIKKNKRIRLDSSPDNISISSVNSKLVYNENDTNEVEMTVTQDNIKDEIDPLSVDIKKEVKTPQKATRNTSIPFIDSEQSAKQEGNESHLYMTLPDDPLEESNTSDSSDSSNNVHVQNYDSVLNDLNKSMRSKKNKKGDISLNIDKKLKQKSIPIVDQLNLTQIKLKKKKQNEAPLESYMNTLKEKSTAESNNTINKSPKDEGTLNSSNKSLKKVSKKPVSKKDNYNENSDNASSSSIDLHLLFSEDNNDSEKRQERNEDDNFIPLKKSHGKTSISDTSETNDKSQIETKKIKKTNSALNKSGFETENCADETEIQFFLDTTGTDNSTAVDNSLNSSTTKRKKGKHIAIDHKDSNEAVEVSNKSVTEGQDSQAKVEEKLNKSLTPLNKSKTKTPKSDKKKKRVSESHTSDSTENQLNLDDIDGKVNQSSVADKSINKSMSQTTKSEKKKAKKISESDIAHQKGNHSDSDAPMEVLNKHVKSQEQQADTGEVINTSLPATNKSITKTPKSDKKKKRISESQKQEQTDTTEIQPYLEEDVETNVNELGIANKSINKSISKTPKSEKKKIKRISESQPTESKDEQVSMAESIIGNTESAIEERVIEDTIEGHENKIEVEDKSIKKSSLKSPKTNKKKKKVPESQQEIQTCSATINTLTKTSSSEKKKVKKISESDEGNNIGYVAEDKEILGSKKRKRKSSLNQIEKEPESEGLEPCPKLNTHTSTASISQNKKRKISQYNDINRAPMANTKITPSEKQHNHGIIKQRHPLENQDKNKRDTADENINNKKGTKKRKEREDDEADKITKVPKVDTNDKMYVPRLPANVLDQLEDKPTKKTHRVTKPKAISTTNFVVEEAKVRKTKPSNYLEESIYLNEDEVLEAKKQTRIKNPKVLPFLPTVSTSNSGYTTNFKVNILPKEIQFVAKSSAVNNYKNDYLQNKKMKRLGTYELYKRNRNRNIKMSKF